MRSLTPFVLVLVLAFFVVFAGGIAAILLGIGDLRGKRAVRLDKRFLYIGIIVLVLAGVFIFFYGR